MLGTERQDVLASAVLILTKLLSSESPNIIEVQN